jgi:hypothetical protein
MSTLGLTAFLAVLPMARRAVLRRILEISKAEVEASQEVVSMRYLLDQQSLL